MAEWVSYFSVTPDMERIFTKEEIELAAQVAFLQIMPFSNVTLNRDTLRIQWSENYIQPEPTKLIRVSGDIY